MATLKTNTLTGTSTAGSIAVTGEGNSTTTNLQQGLAKAWATIDQENSASTAQDSFNVSSITDGGSAKSTITFSNSPANALYSFSFGVCNGGGFNDVSILNVENAQLPNTTNFKFYALMAGVLNPARIASVTFHGDLA